MARSTQGDERAEILAEISGASVQVNPWGGFIWSNWGSARLLLTPTRIVERTKFFISERFTTAMLHQVTSVSIVTQPNPVLLAIGIPLSVILIGLVFLLLALFWRHQYLVIRTAGDVLVIGCKGNIAPYEDFMHDVLDEVERARVAGALASTSAQAPLTPGQAPLVPEVAGPAPRVTSGPSQAQKPVRCGECGAEYRIPSGSAGKRFKCQGCQAIITVADDY
jgi:hypothetical protein